MDNKKSDSIDPRNIPQIPNQENESKQEGTFRNAEEGSRAAGGNDQNVIREGEKTKEDTASPKKDN